MSTPSLSSGLFRLEDSQNDRMICLMQILQSPDEIQAIKKLTGADAQTLIDSVHELLELEDGILHSSENGLYRKACKLIDDLCARAHKLPAALLVTKGASKWEQEPYAGVCPTIYSCERHDGLPDFPGRVLVKRLRCFNPDENNYKKLCREALACRRLCHPHILEFLGLDNKTFGQAHMCLLSPFLKNGTIEKYRDEMGPNNISLAIRMFEITEGLKYRSLVHGDLHPGNILIDNDGRIKLADFGLAVFVNATTTESMGSRTTPEGLITYMAPELMAFKM
ncbi:kinase-like domain-containing protein, partial [Mycena sanguinolenta]